VSNTVADIARYTQKFEVGLCVAQSLSTLSTCKRVQRGAIVVPMDLSSVDAIGYNGPCRGLPNDSCTGEEGKCGCAHAEANAIAKLRGDRGDSYLMVSTTVPCLTCAQMIVNSGRISGVLALLDYRCVEGRELLSAAGIPVVRMMRADGAPWFLTEGVNDQLQKWWTLSRERR
jgi:dCMP deaminase